ncbi:MAG TPA: hemolysin family protein [Fusobacterium sp.]|uniref:hemolysin family protein n=1 Tax=Fusobacterium sp. TaxID=68766 RepID=UPI002F3FBD76
MDTYLYIVVLVILVLLSGFFSASETALTAFRSIHLEKFVDEKKDNVVVLLKKWLKDPNPMLTGLLIGNNIVNIMASSIATVVMATYFGNTGKSILIVTILMTVAILIFGEITPKLIARNHSSEVAGKVISFIYYLTLFLNPLILILVFISKVLGRACGVNMDNGGVMITEEDIISFVNVGQEEGVIEEDEKEMIHSIVGFGETTAKEVMTPRTSMTAFEGSKTIDDIWDTLMEDGFSRIPIYEETIDNILGVLYIKDIMSQVKSGNTNQPIRELVRPAYFVPETKSIIEILKEFKIKKVHIAMVLDEYGGIGGLLTIEDLIEEIVGEIRDEFDEEEEEFVRKVGENSYEVDAMIDIETLDKELGIQLPVSEDYESLGGLITTELGRVTEKGDKLELENVKLQVLEMDKMRISKVLITCEKLEESEEE